jgi:hypothetical protein
MDMETILVGAIVLVAAAYAVYRLFVRRDCGCGRGSACESAVKQGGQSGSGGCRASSSGDSGNQCGCKK